MVGLFGLFKSFLYQNYIYEANMYYLYSKCINFCSHGYGRIEIMGGASASKLISKGWVLVYDRSFTGPETVPPNFREIKAGFSASA